MNIFLIKISIKCFITPKISNPNIKNKIKTISSHSLNELFKKIQIEKEAKKTELRVPTTAKASLKKRE